MKLGIDKCTTCGGDLIEKRVEELVRGGTDTAVITVDAGVCTRCGERFYTFSTSRKLDEVRMKLARGQTEGFEVLGRSFQAK